MQWRPQLIHCVSLATDLGIPWGFSVITVGDLKENLQIRVILSDSSLAAAVMWTVTLHPRFIDEFAQLFYVGQAVAREHVAQSFR